ncbi:MAG: sigma-54 dependent transcriptional regulator, acetoin dehydrogenase operon transcriptional [Petroclostridium sp.]|jgi:PAS domain S-box-containing protein|uniref:sigma-54-dependent Fis family transcriptional regulator n=1 Tax=Petroclostridium xylanilyticum TaxID=1792311 RepID=UPI000B984F9B|nr:sigma 54-interacting transcriptional regulator [Petroclostridium xylanilyticum]MBZ4645303.1 putative transcriptional regulator [Clostridia bacterium]MDK2809482.1 sigma-54 dependent transcriptional regulator, acetoin dehydrogenase operon transcriptional [Petroclostridium sp.]
MSNLLEIKGFIQEIAEAIAEALEIDTSVVDHNLIRIAGTAQKQVTQVISSGVIKKVFETGQYYLTHHTKEDVHCNQCPQKHNCKEKAFMHCPIFFDDKVIGVMGLMCFNDTQREKLISKQDSLLSFIQNMCALITSKLKEYEMYKKEQEMYQKIEYHNIMLHQILNTVSDGYIIINTEKEITHINEHALNILGMTKEEAEDKVITEVIPDLELKSILSNRENAFYDEIKINKKTYGVFISAMKDNKETVGAVISFKIVDKISSRVFSKAFYTKEITFNDILGESRKITDAKELAKKVSVNSTNILLLGESGTGKELFARAIHYASDRHANPFIAVNCAAIPESLLESELFGYESGAFTGANKTGKPGKFELAHTGTIFLDEIGDMPFYLQAKILRVLQDKTIEKIGGVVQKDIDVRIIAATNRNLEEMVRTGKFREDLYYRLNVIPIQIPPLREREGDVELLVEYFIKKYSTIFNVGIKKISPQAIEILNTYHWPGNIRELENLIQYLISVSNSEVIDVDILPNKLLEGQVPSDVKNSNVKKIKRVTPLAEIEREAILNALELFGDTTEGKFKAAKALGIGKTTLYRKLAEYSVDISKDSQCRNY